MRWVERESNDIPRNWNRKDFYLRWCVNKVAHNSRCGAWRVRTVYCSMCSWKPKWQQIQYKSRHAKRNRPRSIFINKSKMEIYWENTCDLNLADWLALQPAETKSSYFFLSLCCCCCCCCCRVCFSVWSFCFPICILERVNWKFAMNLRRRRRRNANIESIPEVDVLAVKIIFNSIRWKWNYYRFDFDSIRVGRIFSVSCRKMCCDARGSFISKVIK